MAGTPSGRGAAAQLLAASVREGGGGVPVSTITPIDTRPLDALALFQMLAVDEVFGTPKAFKETYCGPRLVRVQVPVKVGRRTVYESRQITTYQGASHTAQLHALLARQPWYIRRTKKRLIEQGEMQPKTVNGVDWYDYASVPQPDRIELSGDWQTAYDLAVTQFAQYVMALLAQEHPDWDTLTADQIVALLERKLANVLPKLTLLRQVLGAAKLGAVCERARALNAAGEQVVIIAHHREVVDEYVRRLCRGRELKIQGGMSTREVEAVKRYFNSHGAAEAPVIVLSQDAAKLGHTLCLQRKLAGLPECAHVLIAEEGYNPGPEAQAMDRCILEGQRVITERGFLPIEQVVIGDRVLTHRGNWKRVLDTARRTHRGLVTEITYTRYDEPLRCTHDHRLFVRRGDQARSVFFPKGH